LVAALQQQLREKDVENHVLKLENEALRREAVSKSLRQRTGMVTDNKLF
jgi:regulator of replication initiation timing